MVRDCLTLSQLRTPRVMFPAKWIAVSLGELAEDSPEIFQVPQKSCNFAHAMHRDGGYLSVQLYGKKKRKKKKRGVIPRTHLAESRSRARQIFLQRPRLTYARISNARTWYPTMSHLLHALPLLDTNSYPWPFISYGDARTDTGNIRLFDGGGKNARGRSLYTCYELQMVEF